MKKIMFNDFFGLTQAVLDGRKTQTRRLVKIPQKYEGKVISETFEPEFNEFGKCNYGECFTELYERIVSPYEEGEIVAIAQRYSELPAKSPVLALSKGWGNKMFVKAECMPHQIKITKVRIQHLQDISDEDCLAEGLETIYLGGYGERYICGKHGEYVDYTKSPRVAYAYLIDKISGKGTWDSNPYVWVYEFELVK